MYAPMSIEEVDYYLKPMNCPGHIMIYKSQVRSYRDLPIRFAELGTVYRYERSGTLHGMLRVRGFTQDDAHIFCTPEQVDDEIARRRSTSRSTWPASSATSSRPTSRRGRRSAIGDEEIWERATDALRQALEQRGLPYEIDEGGGAFYGPKIDIKWVDALGREWTGPTIQVDFNLPERFDVNYIGEDGERHRAVMIHRALLGSMERFVGGLIEHYAGAFPVWLAPVQAAIIPIADDQVEYRRRGRATQLRRAGLRVEVDDRARPDAGQDPRRPAAEDPLHAGRRQARGRGRRRRRPPAHRRRPGRDAGRRVPGAGAGAGRVALPLPRRGGRGGSIGAGRLPAVSTPLPGSTWHCPAPITCFSEPAPMRPILGIGVRMARYVGHRQLGLTA